MKFLLELTVVGPNIYFIKRCGKMNMLLFCILKSNRGLLSYLYKISIFNTLWTLKKLYNIKMDALIIESLST